MTQIQLSQATQIPRSTLANILSPTAAPRLIHVEQLVKIAAALQIDLRDWAQELEGRERRRRRQSPAANVQKRAARER